MGVRRLLLLALGALVLAGCGGGSSERTDSLAKIDREIQEALDEVGPIGPGLGETDPPPVITAGWETDFQRHAVPLRQFQSGGPGKDGIPAIDRPRFRSVAKTGYLKPQEPVIELVVDGEARAYPLQILIWHEIVNDRVAGAPVAVTFCPLCNTAIAFDRRVEGRVLDFGTTGNLRNSDLVMYDRQTESWWQQFGGVALVGSYTGARLKRVPARIVSWQQFRREQPGGLVLTRNTGFSRSYGENPYVGYDDASSPPYFAAAHSGDKRLPPKERVVFLERGGESVAVPFSALAAGEVRVTVGGDRLVVRLSGKAASALDETAIAAGESVGTAEVLDDAGRLVAFEEPFWFAVAAFRPDVRVIR